MARRSSSGGGASRRVTINDVADAAGVSITTVSHALNGKGRISDTTRAHVAEKARELGYQPSPVARNLAGGRSGILALSISVSSGQPGASFGSYQYFNELLRAATTESFNRGYAMIAVPDEDDWQQRLARIVPEGLIVIDPPDGNPVVAFARRSGTPIVTAGRTSDGNEFWIDNDHYGATLTALKQLESSGARRIALLGPPADRSYIRDAVAAYRDWCAERHQAPLVAEAHDQSEAEGERVTLGLLDGRDRPDGIYALLDSLGLGVLRAARKAELSVPRDLKLVALTESPFCAQASPPVTTLNLNPVQIAREAVVALTARIEGEDSGAQPSATVPVELVVRDSCGARALAA